MQDLYNVPNSKEDVRVINYRTNKSNGLQTDINTNSDPLPLKISLNDPVYNIQIDTLKEVITSSESSPIVVEPIQEQNSLKSMDMDSKNEYNLESADNITQVTEQVNTNQTEDRKDDLKEEQATDDQILIQEEGITSKQTEFTIPFKKPNPVNGDDIKYNDNEAMKKDIIKVIQNINGGHEQSNQQLNFKNMLSESDKPLKTVSVDLKDIERQKSSSSSHGHSNFKSQQLSNKPLRLFGYNPSHFGSLYDMQIDYNRQSQIQQPPNLVNQGYFAGFATHGDEVKIQAYDSSGTYISQPSSTSQTVSYKGNKKYNVPAPAPAPISTQPLYYYDPNSMIMLPVYTDMIQNTYPIVNKPQSFQSQVDSNKNSLNLMQILSGGNFYKGSEQAEGSQQMPVKDPIIKQEFNKLEKPSETYDKSKLSQTVMFYLNPGESPIDLKSLISNPIQLPFGQQPQADCNGQKLRVPTVKGDKPLQPIPLCSDCVPALGLMGLPSTKSAVIQQKKSIISPQIMPIWNGKNASKLSYLILPNPITK